MKKTVYKSKNSNLLYLSMASFVIIASGTLAFNLYNKPVSLSANPIIKVPEEVLPLPTLMVNLKPFPNVSAKSVLVIDIDSGVTLFARSPDEPMLPASTTKIITALVAMDHYSDNDVFKVVDSKVEGQKMGLVPGEEIRFIDLLKGLLIYSANDAAEVLAQNFPGGREFFIYAMNTKAKQLDLTNSNFTNPVGFDDLDQMVSARDLVIVSVFAIKNPEFAKIVSTPEEIVKSLNGKIAHRLVNVNKLVKDIPGVLGVKTGWTEEAHQNLVTYVDRNGKRIMIALLSSDDRFGETTEIINWVYN